MDLIKRNSTDIFTMIAFTMKGLNAVGLRLIHQEASLYISHFPSLK